jgi:hypothetical protein
MKKVAWTLVLGAALGSSAAHAIVFTSTSFTTVANALTDSAFNTDSKTNPPSLLVLNSTAQSDTDADSSFANATADTLFLVANSEAKSSVGSAHADATAQFNGDFTFPIGSCQAVGCIDKLPLSIVSTQGKVTGVERPIPSSPSPERRWQPLFDQVFSNPGTLNLFDVPFGTQLGNSTLP